MTVLYPGRACSGAKGVAACNVLGVAGGGTLARSTTGIHAL